MKKPKTNNQFVKSLSQLKELIKQGHTNYALVLGGGGMFSRKEINYSEKTKKFKIINRIDESKQTLTEKEIMDDSLTHIGKAMPLNCLIALID